MLNYILNVLPAGHTYSLAAVGLGKRGKSRIFSSRESAKQFMYSLCAKHKLTIKEVWDDNHDKTYKCDHNVVFYIQRNH